MTDLIPVPDMQMVWMRLLAPKSPSFTFPEESLRMLAPGGTEQNKTRVIRESPEGCQRLHRWSESPEERGGGKLSELFLKDKQVP